VYRLGADRFGVFSLAWALAGSVGVFDLGLGRALTKLISDQRVRGDDTATLFGTAMVLLSVAGLVCGIGLALLATSLTSRILTIAPADRPEVIASFRVLAFSVPSIMMFAGVQGTLGAYQRFDLINAVRIPMGALVFLAPVAVLQFRPSLIAAVSAVVAVRIGGCVGLALLSLRAVPPLGAARANRSVGRLLLSFGGWAMVSNIATPVLTYADRFIIGAMVSMTAVAWYTTSLEVVARLAIVPAAVASVLFPEMTGDWLRDPQRVQRLLARGIMATFAAVLPATLVCVAFAGEGLRLWLGDQFAVHGALVLRSFAIGTMVLSVCWMPFYLIQAAHRPEVTAGIHAAEVPLFILAMLIATHYWGLRGAAIVRGATFGLDGLTMLVTARIMMPQIDATFRCTCVMLLVGILASLMVATVPGGIAIKAIVVVAGAITCSGGVWRFGISYDERFELRAWIIERARQVAE